jgi:outer membrane protein assembly factor BamB
VSTAALVGNNVVVGYAGYVYDFNATTGAKVWRTATPVGTIFASPSISGAIGDQVGFVGDQTGDEYAFALSDGSEVFSFHVGHKILASTAISDGMIFFAAGNGMLYALH